MIIQLLFLLYFSSTHLIIGNMIFILCIQIMGNLKVFIILFPKNTCLFEGKLLYLAVIILGHMICLAYH